MSKPTMIALGALALAVIPTAASAESFDGEYLGLQGGVSTLNTDGQTATTTIDINSTKPMVALVAGYRAPLGRGSPIVLGLEGDVGFTIDEFDSRFGISGIAGYKVSESAMVYARGGYASRAKAPTATGTATVDGWMAGGGVEFVIAERLNARIDYRYADLGSTRDLLGRTRTYKGNEIVAGVILDF